MLFLYIAVVVLSSQPLSSKASDTGQTVDDCTSGFISLDRMHAVLGNYYGGDVVDFDGAEQAIIPGINFTCSGSIERWTFGARWEQDTDFIELQIWRPGSENGSYTKVGNTTINVEEEGQTDLYQYPLSSPLHFQAGDILGYYRQMTLMAEDLGSGHPLYTTHLNSSASQFSVDDPQTNFIDQYHVLISVTTDAPGCECGFMSVIRMKILLGLDSVGSVSGTGRRQQITPDIRFTCDGMITKWIVGAIWNNGDILYPELQLWRSSGNDTYQKINGTFIDIETENEDWVYEYDNFPPIPFQAGDILGVFIPPDAGSKLRLRAESGYGHTNHYIPTADSDTVSPYDSIDLQQDTPQVSSSVYHPLVTVEIIALGLPSSATQPPVTAPILPVITPQVTTLPSTPPVTTPTPPVITLSHAPPVTAILSTLPPSLPPPFPSPSLPPPSTPTPQVTTLPRAPPLTTPTSPVTKPTSPVTMPTSPVTMPTSPVTTPTPPVTTPTPPVTTPTPPVTTPTPLVTTSTPPVTTQASGARATVQTSSIPTESVEALSLYIIGGAGGVVVVLIVAAAVTVISVTVCLKKRKSKRFNTVTDNVAYSVSEKEMELSTNANCYSNTLQDRAYDYVTTTNMIHITTAPNEAYVKTSDVPVSSNQAYGIVEHYYD